MALDPIRINISTAKIRKKLGSSQGGVLKKPTSAWKKIVGKYVATKSPGALAAVAWDAVATTAIATVGARANDTAAQNKINNVMSVVDRGSNLINAMATGANLGAGLPGAAVGFILEMINQSVQALQNNIEWKVDNIVNEFRSTIQLESLGLTSSDLNR